MKNGEQKRVAAACVAALIALAMLLPPPVAGQTAGAVRVSLRQVLEEAWSKYPTLEAARAGLAAAEADVSSAKDAYLPRTSIHAQLTRATRNNVLGMMIPNQTIAPISGLVPNGVTGQSTWGTAMGALFSWTAYDFGARRAGVMAAEARQREAEARVGLERYGIADAAADAYFRAIAAEQAEQAAAASVARWKTVLTAVEALAGAGLRPGADISRIRAEVARAEAFELQARQQTGTALAEVGRFLLTPETLPSLESSFAMLRYTGDVPTDGAHPLIALRRATIAARSAEAESVAQQWLPKVDLYSALYGRGTGARIDGTFRGGASGLYPDTGNWAVGVGITLDLFDWKRMRNSGEVRQQEAAAARARESEANLQLRTLTQQARIVLATSKAIAAKTPVALQAARELLTQSEVRYRTGLGDITDLAEAQRTLQLAEVEDAVAKVNVWRAAFGLAVAQGRIEEFVASIPSGTP